MRPLDRHSLLLRLGVAMATITVLAFVGMLSSVIIAETTQGEAAAVNQAGSLRMQSYRIATDLVYSEGMDSETYWRTTDRLVEEFERRLRSPRLADVIPVRPQHRLHRAYRLVAEQWERKIKPVLNAYVSVVAPESARELGSGTVSPELASATRRNIRDRYLAIVDGFVNDIDNLVKLLELDAEAKIRRLRLIQAVSLLLTLAVVFVTMVLMHTQVFIPLRDLLACAASARRGDFSRRTRHEGDDELGRLGHAFNVMAEDLSKQYADLEQRVREKTADLERTNRSYELLYTTSKRLNEAPLYDATFSDLLRDIETKLDIGPGRICLNTEAGQRAYVLAATDHGGPGLEQLCSAADCRLCLNPGSTRVLEPPVADGGHLQVLSIPIRDKERDHGVLLMELPPSRQLEAWQKQLLEAVAGHIGTALNIRQRTRERRRLDLLEERGIIARELHDSLAQSLSYLKIQSSRLEAALRRPHNETAARAVLQELRDGISSAYRQLRELLTTFRLKMDDRGLARALEEAVREFREHSSVTITLDNALQGPQLSANEEIHVLQLVREALSNVVRHAQAEHAQVALVSCSGGRVAVVVEDDGVGIPDRAERRHHYGLAIMEERAHSLGGALRVTHAPEGGTRVELVFTPINQRSRRQAATTDRAAP